MDDTKMLLGLEEAAPLLGRSRDRLYSWVHSGAIPSVIVVHLGGRIFLRKELLMRWLRGELEQVGKE